MAISVKARVFTLVQRELQEYKMSLVFAPIIISAVLAILMLGSVLLANRITAMGDTVLDVIMSKHSGGPVITINIDDDVDVLLCDIDLPGISWEAVFEVLSERHREISAIMLSSHEQVVDVMTALRLGFRDFFHKPIDDWDA